MTLHQDTGTIVPLIRVGTAKIRESINVPGAQGEDVVLVQNTGETHLLLLVLELHHHLQEEVEALTLLVAGEVLECLPIDVVIEPGGPRVMREYRTQNLKEEVHCLQISEIHMEEPEFQYFEKRQIK